MNRMQDLLLTALEKSKELTFPFAEPFLCVLVLFLTGNQTAFFFLFLLGISPACLVLHVHKKAHKFMNPRELKT